MKETVRKITRYWKCELRVLRHERRTNRAETARSHRRIGDFASNRLSVGFDESQITPQQIRAAVQASGYDLIIDEQGGEVKQQQAERNRYLRLRYDTIGAWLFAADRRDRHAVHAHALRQLDHAHTVAAGIVFRARLFVNGWKQLRPPGQHGCAGGPQHVDRFPFSLFNTVYPQFWLRRGLEPHVYYEAACVIIAFVLVGNCSRNAQKQHIVR